jgi:hypothetical protein
MLAAETPAWWWVIGIVITGVQAVLQLRVSMGKAPEEPSWPLIEADTAAGKVGAVWLQFGFLAFCVVGLIWSLS